MKIIYNAYVLTNDSKRKLMEKFLPKFDNTFYHHMTLNFGVQRFPKNLGSEVDLTVIGYAQDEKAQAVVIGRQELGDNRIAHITLSCADGVKPVYSNELLRNGWEKINPFTIKAIVTSITDNGPLTEKP